MAISSINYHVKIKFMRLKCVLGNGRLKNKLILVRVHLLFGANKNSKFKPSSSGLQVISLVTRVWLCVFGTYLSFKFIAYFYELFTQLNAETHSTSVIKFLNSG